MTRTSPASLLFHLLLTAWLSVVLSGATAREVFQEQQDVGTQDSDDSVVARIRRPRNVVDPRDEEPPRFLFMRSAPPVDKEVKLRDTLLLECEAGGSPPPAIHWLKDGVKIRQSFLLTNIIPEDVNVEVRSHGLSSTKSRLLIDCFSSKDQGRYTCVADTPYQRINVVSNVYLSESDSDPDSDLTPACSTPQKSLGHSGQSARILMWTTRLLQTMDKDVVLYCRGAGDPFPTVTWTNGDGDVLRNNNKYHVQGNGDLRIRHITWDDMGEYRCESTNMFGKDSVTTFLYPLAPDDK